MRWEQWGVTVLVVAAWSALGGAALLGLYAAVKP